MDGFQAIIAEEIEKYHEQNIRRDQGEESNPIPKPDLKSIPINGVKLPHGLLQQYFVYN